MVTVYKPLASHSDCVFTLRVEFVMYTKREREREREREEAQRRFTPRPRRGIVYACVPGACKQRVSYNRRASVSITEAETDVACVCTAIKVV